VASDQPSQSMIGTATCRAAHQLLDRPLILEDPIVVGLVPEASEQAVLNAIEWHRSPVLTLLRGLFVFRSRFAEDRLAAAALRGICQCVIVGAGLDTFAWRQPNFARDMRIFYVDHPSSLEGSIALFQQRGLAIPPNFFLWLQIWTQESLPHSCIRLASSRTRALFSLFWGSPNTSRVMLSKVFCGLLHH
jgi:O-methyltransferase involved in polyketide biosynthesis